MDRHVPIAVQDLARGIDDDARRRDLRTVAGEHDRIERERAHPRQRARERRNLAGRARPARRAGAMPAARRRSVASLRLSGGSIDARALRRGDASRAGTGADDRSEHESSVRDGDGARSGHARRCCALHRDPHARVRRAQLARFRATPAPARVRARGRRARSATAAVSQRQRDGIAQRARGGAAPAASVRATRVGADSMPNAASSACVSSGSSSVLVRARLANASAAREVGRLRIRLRRRHFEQPFLVAPIRREKRERVDGVLRRVEVRDAARLERLLHCRPVDRAEPRAEHRLARTPRATAATACAASTAPMIGRGTCSATTASTLRIRQHRGHRVGKPRRRRVAAHVDGIAARHLRRQQRIERASRVLRRAAASGTPAATALSAASMPGPRPLAHDREPVALRNAAQRENACGREELRIRADAHRSRRD